MSKYIEVSLVDREGETKRAWVKKKMIYLITEEEKTCEVFISGLTNNGHIKVSDKAYVIIDQLEGE